MKIVGLRYSALVNLGDYNNEKIELEAALEDGDSAEEVCVQLKERTFSMLDKKDMLYRRQQLRNEVHDLERKVDDARANYEKVAAFMVAQGLNVNPAQFPSLLKEIAGVDAETVTPLYCEVVEENRTESDGSGEYDAFTATYRPRGGPGRDRRFD